jgi:transcriptional regulator with XRE-family HTH domain
MPAMNAGAAIREARERAGLSKRELARRAGTSPAAIVAYEAGVRDPTVSTLERLLAAAGGHARLVISRPPVDPKVAGERLVEVLELAEHLPRRRAPRDLDFPPFPR